MCLVVWSTVSGINIKPKHLCLEDMFQTNHEPQHLQGDHFVTFSTRRRKIFVSQLVAYHCVASGSRISASTVRRRLHNSDLYARRLVVCVPLNRRQRRDRVSWEGEHVSWTRQRWASVLFTDESRVTLESNSGLCSTERNEAPDIIHPTLLKDTVTEMVEQWFGQGSHSLVTLTCMRSRKEL
ncbi:HTH_Tnp_Tc3_2 domain-containing protein [Trichonephila clavipes]|nr:HTH_Tnp_Tc3_2 domain-containing protein [Trichonephila clavipes]